LWGNKMELTVVSGPTLLAHLLLSKIRSGPLMGVWASSATDVFAVGDEGTILHYSLHY